MNESRKSDDGEKHWYIKGVYAMAEKKNNNGRLYPWKVISKGCDEFIEKFVKTKRAIGCLDHPKTPETDSARASHVVTKMWPNEEEKVYEGESRVIKEGCGIIVRSVIEAGGVWAVSTRGIGSVVNGIVQENWKIFAVDVVHMPGASDCVVQAIQECSEYLLDYNSRVYAPELKKMDNILEHSTERSEILQTALRNMLNGRSILSL